MDAAHLPAHGAIEAVAQSVRIVGIGSKSDILDVGGRPVAALYYRSVGFHAKNVCRRDPKHISIHRRCVIGVIEHEEIGELFLA